jgi:hypothetical protein
MTRCRKIKIIKCFYFVFVVSILTMMGGGSNTMKEPSGEYYDWEKTLKPERPYIHKYHQTLVMKIFLAEKRPPVDEHGNPQDPCKVYLTFEQALEVIKKLDNITCGIPKIVYLVGWQFDGHDSGYPSWSKVNHRLKRKQDETATDSLKWLMEEGFKYNTTVSLHINMLDAYQSSPLWETYVKNDIIGRWENGEFMKGEIFGGEQCYYVSYTREWQTGYAQRRIDELLRMLPIQKAGTIHIDAFHTYPPANRRGPISPWLGISPEEEAATQRKIIRYWRDRGVDVTCEGSIYDLRIDPFVGLQPMAWHYTPIEGCPPSLYCGTPMQAEQEIKKDPQNLSGLLEQFCLKVVPWYYENNETYPHKGKHKIREGNDTFVPALWCKKKTIIAYSENGYYNKKWELPPDWKKVKAVEVSEITLTGPKKIAELPVKNNSIILSLKKGQGVIIKTKE